MQLALSNLKWPLIYAHIYACTMCARVPIKLNELNSHGKVVKKKKKKKIQHSTYKLLKHTLVIISRIKQTIAYTQNRSLCAVTRVHSVSHGPQTPPAYLVFIGSDKV